MPIQFSGGELDPHNISQDTVDSLPDDVKAVVIAAQLKRQQVIDALGSGVKKAIDENIRFRAQSGIETEWTEDEEFYEGVDDANRGESKYIKPNHPSGVLTQKRVKNKKSGSTVFFNITRQYVDNAAASVSEMGNPTNDRNFELKANPVPDIAKHEDNQTPHPATDAQGQPVAATVGDFAQQAQDAAQAKAEAAQEQIDTWLIKCQWHAQLRECVTAAAKIGSGAMRGPLPTIYKGKKAVQSTDESGKTTTGLEVEIETVPSSKAVSVWNLFPSPDCGNDIQSGSNFIERDFTNARGLRDMKLLDGYIATQIDKVLDEGPSKEVKNKRTNNNVAEDSEQYTLWYYYGQLTRDQIEAMSVADTLKKSSEADDIKALKRIEMLEACPCIVTMVNDIPIRASLNPLDTGEYPYDIWCWEKREDSPWGRGISRIMRTAQRVTTAALRNLMDNAALSGGVQIGIKKGSVKPMGGGDWKLSSVGFWEMTDEDARGIQDVLSFTQIPSVQKELMEIIQFGQKMAEDVTGMPLLLQGQQGSAPDTVGGMQMLNKNANATRRQKARSLDDDCIEPHIRRYYQWILMYGDESAKGDYTIDARGSQALVERDIARQFSIQMINNALQPSFGIDPYKAMGQVLRAEMIEPSTWQYDEDTYKQNMAKQQQAGNPVIQAAQIRTASAEKIAAEQIAADTANAKTTAEATVSAVQARTQRDDAFAQASLQAKSDLGYKTLEIQKEIALLQYATQEKISLNAAKVQMANKTMELQTEKELAGAANQMTAAIHVSEGVQADHQQGQDIAAQGGQNAHEQATLTAQQEHEKELEAMKQQHAAELQKLVHAHQLKMKPAVQVPGRAANGHALDQTTGK